MSVLYRNSHHVRAFFFVLVFVVRWLCSQGGWLLLKWSTIGVGFDGAETNCEIVHILGTLLMISCWFHFYFRDIIVKIGHTRTHYSFLIQRTKSYPPVLAADLLELKCHRRTDCVLSRRHTWRKTRGDFGSLKTSYFLKIITCNCTKGLLPCQDEIQLQPCAIRTKIQHKPGRNKEFWQVYVMVGR